MESVCQEVLKALSSLPLLPSRRLLLVAIGLLPPRSLANNIVQSSARARPRASRK